MRLYTRMRTCKRRKRTHACMRLPAARVHASTGFAHQHSTQGIERAAQPLTMRPAGRRDWLDASHAQAEAIQGRRAGRLLGCCKLSYTSKDVKQLLAMQ